MSIGYPKLLGFILQNGRFPFSSGVDDNEKQLFAFWRRQQHYYEAGELSASGLEYHTKILNEYGHLQMDKKEYEWRRKYAMAWRVYVEKEVSDLDPQSEDEVEHFFANMTHDYRYGRDSMPEWKKEAVENLLDHLQNTDNVQDNLG